MSLSRRAFTINSLFLWLAISSVICGSDAALRTRYVEELCYGSNSATLNLLFESSAILASVPTGPVDCEITLKPVRDNSREASIVIALSRYSLEPSDSLVFRDRHNFELSLNGRGIFLDERKSFTFEAPVTIHYVTNKTYGPNKLKFQLVYTQVFDTPCGFDEFKCRNEKCISKDLTCDKHNHCGYLGYQDDCSPENAVTEDDVFIVKERVFLPKITIIVAGVVVGIIVIVVTALLIRICVVRKKQTKEPELPTVAPQLPAVAPQLPAVAAAPEVQPVAPPSVFGRIRESFRVRRQPTAPPIEAARASEHTSENYEVPSMYPNLPAETDNSGVDNPEFKAEE